MEGLHWNVVALGQRDAANCHAPPACSLRWICWHEQICMGICSVRLSDGYRYAGYMGWNDQWAGMINGATHSQRRVAPWRSWNDQWGQASGTSEWLSSARRTSPGLVGPRYKWRGTATQVAHVARPPDKLPASNLSKCEWWSMTMNTAVMINAPTQCDRSKRKR